MKVLLVMPPDAFPEGPYLSVPALTAYLRAHTTHEVAQQDLNLEFANYWLSEKRLSECRHRLTAELAVLTHQEVLQESELLRHGRLSRILRQTAGLVDELPLLRQQLRTCYTAATFLEKRRAHRLYGLVRDLISLEFSSFFESPQLMHWDTLSAILDAAHNPYKEFYDTEAIPAIRTGGFDLVGISVPYESHLIPALTLARCLKPCGIDVVLGGPYVTHLRERIAAIPDLLKLPRAWVLYEGEEPLCRLADALARGTPLCGVPNLLLAEEDGSILRTPVHRLLDSPPTPTPDYDGVFERGYFASRTKEAPVFPLLFSSGCYWGKCTFCTHPVVSSRYHLRTRGVEVFHQVRDLMNRHAARRFAFQDSAVPLGPLRSFVRLLIEEGLAIEWAAVVHMERSLNDDSFCELLRRSGCRILSTGLESGSQHVLDLMKKGYRIEEFVTLAERLFAHGIALRLTMMFGFPGETAADRSQTIELISGLFQRLNRERILFYCDFTVFMLEEYAPIGQAPGAFGVEWRRRPDCQGYLGPESMYIVNQEREECVAAIRHLNGLFREHILRTTSLRAHLLQGGIDTAFLDDFPTEFTAIALEAAEEIELGYAERR